jgi:hypothetical protein
VPQERVSMRKIKEVLRLRFELGLQQNQIARSCSIGQATVHRYLQRAAAAGLSWPLAEDLDDNRLQKLLFREARARPSQSRRSLPEFNEVRRQLQTHKHVTLQLVWEEYRETQPDGYSYSHYVAAVFMLRTESSRQVGGPSAELCSNITGRLLSCYRPFRKAINEGSWLRGGAV